MAGLPLEFSYFEIKLNLATDGRLRISAKQSLSDDGEYRAGDFTRLDIFEEVLSKLAIALHGEKRPIRLQVSGGSIVRDDSFKLPACSQATAKTKSRGKAKAVSTAAATAKPGKAADEGRSAPKSASAQGPRGKKNGAANVRRRHR